MKLQWKFAIVTVVSLFVFAGVAMAASGIMPGPIQHGLKAISGSTPAAGDQHVAGDDSTRHGEYNAGESAGSEQDNDDSFAGSQVGEHENHGSEVSDVARDKDATETMTLPNGKEIENHGQAVRQVAGGDDNEDLSPGITSSGGQMGGNGGEHDMGSGHNAGASTTQHKSGHH